MKGSHVAFVHFLLVLDFSWGQIPLIIRPLLKQHDSMTISDYDLNCAVIKLEMSYYYWRIAVNVNLFWKTGGKCSPGSCGRLVSGSVLTPHEELGGLSFSTYLLKVVRHICHLCPNLK